MIVGCYVLNLYCDSPHHPRFEHYDGEICTGEPHEELTDERGSVCRSEARRKGWKLNLRKGTAICRRCQRGPWTGDKAPKRERTRAESGGEG